MTIGDSEISHKIPCNNSQTSEIDLKDKRCMCEELNYTVECHYSFWADGKTDAWMEHISIMYSTCLAGKSGTYMSFQNQ